MLLEDLWVKKPLVGWNEGNVPFSSLFDVVCTILSYQPWGRWVIGMLEHYIFVLSCLIIVPLVRFIKNILFVDVMEVMGKKLLGLIGYA